MSRGFFRLWVIGSAIWVTLAVFALSYDHRPNSGEIMLEASLVPPAAVFVIGLMLRWAFSGFRRD